MPSLPLTGYAEDISDGRCPACEAKIYFSRKFRWLRGISCGLLTIVLMYRWYPLEGSLSKHLVWSVASLAVFMALLFASLKVLPGEVELVRRMGLYLWISNPPFNFPPSRATWLPCVPVCPS